MIRLSDLKLWKTRPYAWHWLVNIVVASCWLYYVWDGLMSLQTTRLLLLSLALLVRNTTVTVMFLIRRPSTLTSRRFTEWFMAIAGTFCSYFYVLEGAWPIYRPLVPPTYFIMAGAALISVIAILNLGRSFGIVPANRGIKTKGLYGIVRHPIYLLYVIFDLAFLFHRTSARNWAVFLLYILVAYFRAKHEERVLQQDPAYQQYMQKTRYMFLPGII